MKNIDWSEKVKPDHINWQFAEDICREIASTGKDLDDPARPRDHKGRPYSTFLCFAPFEYIPGYGVSPPWVANPRTDRIIAYHGFDGAWVGWTRGGAVIKLEFKDIVRFLRGEM